MSNNVYPAGGVLHFSKPGRTAAARRYAGLVLHFQMHARVSLAGWYRCHFHPCMSTPRTSHQNTVLVHSSICLSFSVNESLSCICPYLAGFVPHAGTLRSSSFLWVPVGGLELRPPTQQTACLLAWHLGGLRMHGRMWQSGISDPERYDVARQRAPQGLDNNEGICIA